jgi:hypothetical protein
LEVGDTINTLVPGGAGGAGQRTHMSYLRLLTQISADAKRGDTSALRFQQILSSGAALAPAPHHRQGPLTRAVGTGAWADLEVTQLVIR